MIFRPLGSLAEQVLISLRHTRFTMRMSILGCCVTPLAFYVAALWQGPVGVAAAWMVLIPVTILPMLFKLLRTIELSAREFLGAVWPAVAGTAAMVPTVLLLHDWLTPRLWPVVLLLGAKVAAGGLVYAAVLVLFFRPRLDRYVRFAQDLRSRQPVAAAAPGL
jgi:O-antigen/teichoic acid export membrane protein